MNFWIALIGIVVFSASILNGQHGYNFGDWCSILSFPCFAAMVAGFAIKEKPPK